MCAASSGRGPWTIGCCLLIGLAAGCNRHAAIDDGDADGAPDAGEDVSGNVHYVSAEGDDQADGQSTDTAFRTLARAAEALRPGHTMAIMPGTYREALTLDGLGSAEATITIRGEGGTPVLDGERTREASFMCFECTNVVFENLELVNYTDMGILVNLSSNVTLGNLIVHGNGFAAQADWAEGYGIHADDSSGITIENNEVYENGPNPQIPGKWLGTGINTFGLTDSVIRNNNSHDNIGGGLLVEDSVNVLVEGNQITGNNLDATIEEWWDGGIWVDGGRDVTLLNNTVTDNIGPGVVISDEDNQQPVGYLLEGNTITGNRYGIYVWNFGTTELPSEDILRLSSNDVSGNTVEDYWIVDWECPPEDPCE